jgi:hypothetical protein
MEKSIAIVITKRQRDLILKYGYPFKEISNQLKKGERYPNKKTISADNYWWQQLLGNLAMSLNHGDVKNEDEYWESQELCDMIEYRLR